MERVRKAVTPAFVLRAAAYCGLLVALALRMGSFTDKHLIALAVFLLGMLLLPALSLRWPRLTLLIPALTALADFTLVAVLALQGYPSFELLFILILAADGILAGWKITLALGLVSGAFSLYIAYAQYSNLTSLSGYIPELIFWLILTAITTAWAWQREKEIRARANLEDNLQVRSDRLSMLSHEVRTPLTLMRTSLELLFDESAGPLTKQQRTFLETIYQNEERVASLAQNLLTQAKLEAGVFSPKFQPVDLRHIVRDAVDDLRAITDQRSQRISTWRCRSRRCPTA